MNKSICFAGFANEELESLKHAMSGISGTWNCAFAANAKAALAAMAQKPFDVVVANMHTTGVNGAELLCRVGELHRDTLRFVVGDMGDQELIINCIGGTHHFIARPFKPQELILVVQRGLSLDACLSSDALRALAPKLRRLPSLPSTYFEVLKKVESPNTTVQSVGEVIARDPAATARLLQMVNSAAFALEQKVTDPVDAVSLLGLETVKSLVLCLQVFSQSDEAKQAGLSLEQLWSHSFFVAKAARRIVLHQTANARLSNDAFTAGLLHDVGRIVIASNLPKEYAAVVAAARQKACPLHEEESLQLGVTHAQVGAYLLGLWGMPATLVEAAALHHVPGESSSSEFSLLTAVHISNVFAHEQEARKDGLPAPQINQAYLKSVGFLEKVDVWRKVAAGEKLPAGDTERISQPTPKPRAQVLPVAAQQSGAPRSRSNWLTRVFIPATAATAIVAAILWWNNGGRMDNTLPVNARSMPEYSTQNAPAIPVTEPPQPIADGSSDMTGPGPKQQTTLPAVTTTSEGAPATASNVQANPSIATATVAAPVQCFSSVKVQGIFYSANQATVIINGKSLGVGERINGVEVISIGPLSVVLSCNGERRAFNVK